MEGLKPPLLHHIAITCLHARMDGNLATVRAKQRPPQVSQFIARGQLRLDTDYGRNLNLRSFKELLMRTWEDL